MKHYLTLTCLAALLAACEKVSEYEGPLPGPKLVLYSFVEQGREVRVDVRQTRRFSNQESELPAGVSGEVYLNDTLAAPLVTAWDDAWNHVAAVIPRPGDRVRVVARAAGVKEVEATVTLPLESLSIRVDTTLVGPREKLEQARFTIRVDDPARERHYYRLVVETETFTAVGDEVFNATRHYSFNPENDPLLVGSTMGNALLYEDVPPNRYHIFTNESFEGTGCTIRVSATARNTMIITYDRDGQPVVQRDVTRLHVKVARVDEATYLHLKSIMLMETGTGIMEPVQVYTNVRDGAGVVGYACFSTASFEMPAVTWEEKPLLSLVP
jgi:hypothetical protein